MKKEKYVSPHVGVLELEIESSILAGSGNLSVFEDGGSAFN